MSMTSQITFYIGKNSGKKGVLRLCGMIKFELDEFYVKILRGLAFWRIMRKINVRGRVYAYQALFLTKKVIDTGNE